MFAGEEGRALSEAALELHRHCRELAPPAFVRLSWDILSSRIPFEAACWFRGHDGDPARADAHANGCTAHLIRDYARVSARVRSPRIEADETIVTVGLDYAESTTPRELAAFGGHWRVRYGLAIHFQEPVACLTSDIVLWRKRTRYPFDTAEQRLMRALAPHLIDTYCANRLAYVARTAGGHEREAHACAIADHRGCLRVVPVAFQTLLLREFPEWRGPRLPPRLVQLLTVSGQSTQIRFAGAKIFLRMMRTGDTYLIQGRDRHPLDSLTVRQFEVARLSAQGLGYREIAAALGISRVTARNHLNSLLTRTGAPKRPRIAAQLAELE